MFRNKVSNNVIGRWQYRNDGGRINSAVPSEYFSRCKINGLQTVSKPDPGVKAWNPQLQHQGSLLLMKMKIMKIY